MPKTVPLLRDTVRRVLNVTLSFLQIVVTLFPLWGYGVFIGARDLSGWRTAAEPAGYAFAIWTLIYPLLLAYAVYQALPSHRRDDLLRRTGWWTALSFLLCGSWALLAEFGGDDVTLFAIIVLMAVAATLALLACGRGRKPLTRREQWLVKVPLSVFAAWVTAATFVSIAIVLKAVGWLDAGNEVQWSTAIIVVAGVLGAVVTAVTGGNIAYALTIIWALVGIMVANTFRNPHLSVVIVAGGSAIVVALTLLASLRKRVKKQRGMFARLGDLFSR